MVNELFKLFLAKCIIYDHTVPMLLIHVVAGYNAFVLFPQLYCPLRITFCIELQRLAAHSHKQEYLAIHFKDKRILTKWKTFLHIGLRQTIRPDLFYVHHDIKKRQS